MQRQSRFEGERTIVLPGRRAEDIIWVAMGAGFLGLAIWAASEAVLSGTAVDTGFVALVLMGSPFLVWAMAGSISRLRDRRAFFQADTEGLQLYPSFWPRSLPWSSIRSLSVQTDPFGGTRFGAQNGQIRIRLREPGHAPAYPFGTLEIRVHLRRLALSRKEAADLLRQLRRLRAHHNPVGEEEHRMS